jgi:hypothetical protein
MLRRAAASTKWLTSAATPSDTTSATAWSASAIARRWNGGVKNQLAHRNPPTAARKAGSRPPTAAVATTSARYRTRTVGSSIE